MLFFKKSTRPLIRVGCFVLSVIMALSLCGCGQNDSSDNDASESTVVKSEVKKFMSYVNGGEYVKAIEYYNKELYGNYTFESEAGAGITNLLNRLNEDVLSGEKGENDSRKVIVVIDNVLENTTLQIDGYDEMKDTIEASIASKASFSAGKELEELQNYADAISEYKNVIRADSNYAAAQTAIERCQTTFKKNVFDKVAVLAEQKEYWAAISQLKALGEKLPEDDEVIAKISVYEKTYISNTIEKAAELFATPSSDYLQALEIINSALQHYSDNEDLNAQKTYYQSFAPVNLYDMKNVKGNTVYRDEDTDTYNNTYTKCFLVQSGSFGIWTESTDITFDIKKEYNDFKFTVYSRSSNTQTKYCTIVIYGDGIKLYENTKVKSNSKAYDVLVNVTGISELRIVMRDNEWKSDYIGMTNMLLQKSMQ